MTRNWLQSRRSGGSESTFGGSGFSREPDPSNFTPAADLREDAVLYAPTNWIAPIGDMSDDVLMRGRSHASSTMPAAYAGEHFVLEIGGTGS